LSRLGCRHGPRSAAPPLVGSLGVSVQSQSPRGRRCHRKQCESSYKAVGLGPCRRRQTARPVCGQPLGGPQLKPRPVHPRYLPSHCPFPEVRESTPTARFKEPNSVMRWPLKSWLWRLVHWGISTLDPGIQALNWWSELSQRPAISLKKDNHSKSAAGANVSRLYLRVIKLPDAAP
jgi:hypothetical protein